MKQASSNHVRVVMRWVAHNMPKLLSKVRVCIVILLVIESLIALLAIEQRMLCCFGIVAALATQSPLVRLIGCLIPFRILHVPSKWLSAVGFLVLRGRQVVPAAGAESASSLWTHTQS